MSNPHPQSLLSIKAAALVPVTPHPRRANKVTAGAVSGSSS